MAIRREEIQKLKDGNYIMVDDEPCIIKSTERSKSGKHGHAKVRVICVGMFDENKRSLTIPSGHTVEVPEIDTGNAQINYIEDKAINIMDSSSYESFDVKWPDDPEMRKKLENLRQNPQQMAQTEVEYWRLAGRTLINRIYSK
ncbi:MAG: translation initiation factor IF-5A [Promethearchaeota archaeon]|nr:MAG: translation initiation factor IF-5A [Candidatus Lokiarchaeota archaeon]